LTIVRSAQPSVSAGNLNHNETEQKMTHQNAEKFLFGAIIIGLLSLTRLAWGDDGAKPTTRPVEEQLKAKADEAVKKSPEVAKVITDGIAEVAATCIDENAPNVGDKATLFELPDAGGRMVKLADLLKKGPVVLTWYRGGWCPYCNISLRGLVEAEPSIRQLGATLVAITPETPDYAENTIKADALTYEVLSDSGNRVAHQYRIAYKVPEQVSARMKTFKIDLAVRNGDTSDELPLPATYVIDQEGTIRWAFVDADYRKRAEPADVVEALRKLKK
jgi:peroxiredoxin